MRALLLSLFLITPAIASDYIPQVTTSEVYTKTECIENRAVKPRTQYLQPVQVHTGRTVIVQDHYRVYQPKIVYEYAGDYTTTQICTTCK